MSILQDRIARHPCTLTLFEFNLIKQSTMKSADKLSSISVVIPNRNDSAYLENCLNSVLYQSVLPDQIIFVDDQSSDNSLAMAEEILGGINVVQLISNSTCLGTMGALNEGLKKVTSDYVLFLSSNDFLVDGIFERAKYNIAATGSPGVWSAMVWAANKNGIPLYRYPSPVIALKDKYFSPEKCVRLALKTGNWFTGTTLIFHRKTLENIGGLDEEYQGLGDLFAALTISSIKGAFFSPVPFGVMRLHTGGYMWRTLTDLDVLEAILAKIGERGQKLSPILFSPKFCDRTKHRFRFAAIRASQDNRWIIGHRNWFGARYRFLKAACLLLGNRRKSRIILAFLLLRPFDVLTRIWYRLMGTIWTITRRTKTNDVTCQ